MKITEDKPMTVIDEPKNLIELVVHPNDRHYTLGSAPFSPKAKTLSRKKLIDYINSLPKEFVFIKWDYPDNDRYKMIEALYDGSIE